jgi:hypothetical protein
VRFEVAVKKMTVGQAGSWGIDATRRGFFFRAGSIGSKRNYTAPEESEWFERLSVVIAGEAVVYCIPWQPPSARLDDQEAAKIIAAVGKGTKAGPYSTQLSNTVRSLASVFEAMGITSQPLQRCALTNLINAGRIAKAKWRPKGFGEHKTLTGLRTQNGLPSGIDWIEEEEL